MGPAERMLTVLARLRTHPDRVWHARDVKRDIPGYEGPDGERNWQYDSEALRARGLIRTAITTRHTPRRTGVRYALPVKPLDLHLSEREHAALVAARRARGTAEMPSPLAGGTGRGKQIAVIAEALRRLEERDEWMSVGDLAREMGRRPDRLWEALKTVWFLEIAPGRGSLDILDVGGDAVDGEPRAAQRLICVVRGRRDPQRPLLRAGLALLGAGAYTLEETAERLELIEDVLAGRLPGDAEALQAAKLKLLRWQEMLRSSQR